MLKQLKLVAGLAITATLVACGGGGDSGTAASSPTPSPTPTPTPTPTAFTVGGTVYGLDAGKSLSVKNGTETIIVSSNGAFKFQQTIGRYDSYAVSIVSQPTLQSCDLANGFGNGSGQINITNITVNCVPGTYKVSGVVTGLLPAATVGVSLNEGSVKTVGNGPFAFDGALPIYTPLSLLLVKQPNNGQICAIAGNISQGITQDLTANIGCFAFVLTSLSVVDTSDQPLVANGLSHNLTILGSYSDGSTFISNYNGNAGRIPQVETSLSDPTVVSFGFGANGAYIKPLKAGTSTLTVFYGPVSTKITFTVK